MMEPLASCTSRMSRAVDDDRARAALVDLGGDERKRLLPVDFASLAARGGHVRDLLGLSQVAGCGDDARRSSSATASIRPDPQIPCAGTPPIAWYVDDAPVSSKSKRRRWRRRAARIPSRIDTPSNAGPAAADVATSRPSCTSEQLACSCRDRRAGATLRLRRPGLCPDRTRPRPPPHRRRRGCGRAETPSRSRSGGWAVRRRRPSRSARRSRERHTARRPRLRPAPQPRVGHRGVAGRCGDDDVVRRQSGLVGQALRQHGEPVADGAGQVRAAVAGPRACAGCAR